MKLTDVNLPIGQRVRIDDGREGVIYDVGRMYVKVLTEDGRHRDCYRKELFLYRGFTFVETSPHGGRLTLRGQYCIHCRMEMGVTSGLPRHLRHLEHGNIVCAESRRKKKPRRASPREAPKVPRRVALAGNVEIETFAGIRRIITQK